MKMIVVRCPSCRGRGVQPRLGLCDGAAVAGEYGFGDGACRKCLDCKGAGTWRLDFDAAYEELLRRCNARWWFGRLRKRTSDGERQDVKVARAARAVRLFARWWYRGATS